MRKIDFEILEHGEMDIVGLEYTRGKDDFESLEDEAVFEDIVFKHFDTDISIDLEMVFDPYECIRMIEMDFHMQVNMSVIRLKEFWEIYSFSN